MTDAALIADINMVSRLRGSFQLRSGATATAYFDKYRFESDPALLRRIAEAMIALFPPQTEILAGLELGGVPIATALSLKSGMPAVFVRKKAKEYGTCQAIEGRDVKGRKVLIVEDVISTGGAVVQAAQMLQEAGARLVGVLCAIWRPDRSPHIDGLDAPVFALMTGTELDAGRQ